MEALLPTPTLPVLIRTCWNNNSCYLTIHGISYPELGLYVICFDFTGLTAILFVPSGPGILFYSANCLALYCVPRQQTIPSFLSGHPWSPE